MYIINMYIYIYNIRVFVCIVQYYIYIKLYVHSLQISRETSIPQPTIPPTRLHPQHPQEVLLGESHMWIKVCNAAVQASSFRSQWVNQAAFRLIF